jgi:hypothetical protein
LIGIVGAVSVFSLTNGLWWVLLPAIPAAGCFAWGIYAGGRGIEHMAQAVEKGMTDSVKPDDAAAHEDFSRVRWRFQRGLELLFVTAVVASLPNSKKPAATEQLYGIAERMREVAEATTKAASTREDEIEAARRRIEALERHRAALSKRLDALESCMSRRRNVSRPEVRPGPGPLLRAS